MYHTDSPGALSTAEPNMFNLLKVHEVVQSVPSADNEPYCMDKPVSKKPNYCQGEGCKTKTVPCCIGEDNGLALDTEVCQIQAQSAEINVLNKGEPIHEVQFQQTFSAVIKHNLHKDQTNQEVLNQATNGKIASILEYCQKST